MVRARALVSVRRDILKDRAYSQPTASAGAEEGAWDDGGVAPYYHTTSGPTRAGARWLPQPAFWHQAAWHLAPLTWRTYLRWNGGMTATPAYHSFKLPHLCMRFLGWPIHYHLHSTHLPHLL